jgi:hypothetical protein
MAYHESIAEPRTFRPTPRFRLRAGLLGKAVTAFGVPRQRQRTRKGLFKVIEAVASASRYKRYKIGGK